MRGLRLFDEGRFFDAHEIMEDEWRDEPGDVRELYQGLIQAAVAFYHAENSNRAGVKKMVRAALPKLEKFRPSWCGVPLDALIESLHELDAESAGVEHPRLAGS